MKVASAVYILDAEGDQVGIEFVDDQGETHQVPVNGTTWLNHAVNDWVTEGNTVASGTIPQPE